MAEKLITMAELQQIKQQVCQDFIPTVNDRLKTAAGKGSFEFYVDEDNKDFDKFIACREQLGLTVKYQYGIYGDNDTIKVSLKN